jgi:hypothetical protein
MKEKFVMKRVEVVPKHEEMFLDQSLYELEVEKLRFDGRRRERKGALSAIKQFLDTPKGKMLGMAMMGLSATANVRVAYEYLMRGERDVYAIVDTPGADSFAGDRPLDEVRGDLTRWLGEDAVREMVPVVTNDRDRAARDRRREAMRSAEAADVEGFEAVGIDNELIEEYLEEGFPCFMTARSNVDSVEFTSRHEPLREDYHLGHGAEAAGTCSVGAGEIASDIRLYGALLDSNGRLEVHQALEEVLIHELAHAIDWENLDAVDPATRARMLHQMVSHVRDEHRRLPFSYVERINSKNPQEQLRNRTTEYYAEFASAVFRMDSREAQDSDAWINDITRSLLRQYGDVMDEDREDYDEYVQSIRDDVRLVREVVETYDSDFDFHNAYLERGRVLTRVTVASRLNQLQDRISSIPSESLRREFEELLQESGSEPLREHFLSLAGATTTYTENVTRSGAAISPTLISQGRELEREIASLQRHAIEELERGIPPAEMPAYRHLIALLEYLPNVRLEYASDGDIEVVRGMMADYQNAVRNASSSHIDFAHRYIDILLGRDSISPDIDRRINSYLSAIESETRG